MATSGSNATVSSGSATSPLAVNSRPQLQSPVQGWATQFKIPWSCLADDFIKACSEGKRPDKPALLAAVRVVAGEIKKVTSHPRKGDLNIIANSMVAKYPKTLADFLPNIGMLGNGSTSLTFRFVRIFENMNRSGCNSLRRKLLNPTDENEETSGTARKKVATSKLVKDSYGCVSWQPDLPSGETSDSQNEKKEWLISEFLKSLEERDQVKIQQYMEKTYASQRFLLNGINKPSVIALKNHWPFLLTSDGLLAHFNRLMGFDLHSRFLEHFSTKGRLLVNYAKLNGSDAAKSVAARLEAECNFVHNSLPITFGSLQVLSHLLKEEQTLLIMYEVCKHAVP
jgi:hypothetical protein